MPTGNSSDSPETEVISWATKQDHEILKIHCAKTLTNFGPYSYRKSSLCSQRFALQALFAIIKRKINVFHRKADIV